MNIERKRDMLGMGATFVAHSMFGFTFVFIKQVLNAGMSPYALLAWRLTIATILMLLLSNFFAMFRLNFSGKKLWKLLPLALCEPILYFLFESVGIALTTASESGTIIALIPIWVLILCRLVFKEQQTKGQVIGVSVSVAGIICVVLSSGLSASFSLPGYLCLFGAVIISGFFSVGVRIMVQEFSSAEILFGTNALGLVFFAIATCVQGFLRGDMAGIWLLPLYNTHVLLNVLLLAVGASIIAYMLVIFAIGRIGPTRSSTFTGMVTINSIVFGLLILGERMQVGQLIGAAMIIAGVWAANYFVPRPETEQKAEQPAKG